MIKKICVFVFVLGAMGVLSVTRMAYAQNALTVLDIPPVTLDAPTTISVTGRVTGSDGGNVGAVRVRAEPLPLSSITWRDLFVTTTVDASGYFTFTDLPNDPPIITLTFNPPQDTVYVAKVDRHRSPFTVTLIPGQTISNVNVVLQVGGRIRGEVKFASIPSSFEFYSLWGPHVDIVGSTGKQVKELSGQEDWVWRIDGSGKFSTGLIPPGRYFVRFVVPGSVPKFYANAYSLEQATPITVTAGAEVSLTTQLDPIGDSVRIATSAGAPNVIMALPKGYSTPRYSTNSGQTWQGLTVPEQPIVDIGVAPKNDQQARLIASGTRTLYRSGDFGISWSSVITTLNEGVCSFTRCDFVKVTNSPVDSRRLYAIYEFKNSASSPEAANYQQDKLYVSNDAGGTWQYVPNDLESPYLTTVLIPSPIVGDQLYAVKQHFPNFSNDHTRLAFEATQLYFSNDAGKSWSTKPFPVNTLTPDAKRRTFLFGMKSYRSGEGESSWNSMYTSDLFRFTGKRSRDAGTTWVDWMQQPCPDSFQQLLSVPKGASSFLLMRCDEGLYRSYTDGDSWERLLEKGVSILNDLGNPGCVFLVKDNDLWASNDDGSTWVRLADWQLTQRLFMPIVAKSLT